MVKVLAIDDEEPFRRLLKKELSRKGFYIETAADAETAVEMAENASFDVVLLDIVMPGMDGLGFMKQIRKDDMSPAIIVLTGKATVDTAVEAMKNGAYDYLTKPYKLDELIIAINRADEYGKLKVKNRALEQELVKKEAPDGFVYKSRQLKEILSFVKKIAPTDSTVFIQGESGTGKELIANTIWHLSRRSASPVIALNCATFSENLIESELFGHEKGAFTSAFQTKYGIVEAADKGTIFLDEIGEMPFGLQAKLLRFLDLGEFRRVGGNKTLTVDVRVIAATNKDLQSLIREGKFRNDLYYRLNVINITIPPLRERKDDIPGLSEYFLRKYSAKLLKFISGFMPEAFEMLKNYDWPGNVRELENVIERAVIICDSEKIRGNDLSMPSGFSKENDTSSSLEDIEKNFILKVMEETGWNQSKASRLLGIDRKTLYLKLKKYGVRGFALFYLASQSVYYLAHSL